MTGERSPWLSARALMGFAVIAIGLVWTLDNLGLAIAPDLRRLLHRGWPIVFVLIGLAKLREPGARREPGGYVWVALGVLLLAHKFALLNASRLWPLLLVLGGASMVWRAMPERRRRQASDSPDGLHALAVMGSAVRGSSSPDFRGGDLTAVMGGVEVDLRQASIAQPEAVLDVFAMWGGVEVRVPGDWEVVNRGWAFLGGFEDTTHHSAGTSKRLVVTGLAIMGGVEIKN